MTDKLINPDDLRSRIENRYKQRGEFAVHLVVFLLTNLFLWGLWAFAVPSFQLQWLLAFPWPMVVLLGWGSGLAAHGLTVFYEAGPQAVRLEERIADEMLERFGYDWQQTATQKEYQGMRQTLEKPYNERKEVIIHSAVFTVINLMLWWMWALLPGYVPPEWTVLQFPWPLLVTLGWGIGMVAHIAKVYFESGFSTAARDGAIQREMERVYGAAEKPKRHTVQGQPKRKRDRLVLTDDGELIEVVPDVYDEEDEDYDEDRSLRQSG